ncbi:cilia- and flagella-associated protein 45-like [Orbicella faveolata]|uniref:cilia- and flagella-associated protein 45-like n=1 Tax=Orbicella faveolata TaxID=48498 RepID=UPI0009E36F33|nr:cilia- and flagella-associated protein 45-like [Orbicella faveolata]
MPNSTVGSVESAGSNVSRKSWTRQYHTVNKTSTVDESLFASPKKTRPGEENAFAEALSERSRRRSSGKNSPGKSQEPEMIQVITKDLIRRLRVPKEDPSGRTIILEAGEFQRIKSASHVPTQTEREAAIEELKQRKEALQNASEERKNFMQTMELKRKENAKPSDLEQEAMKESGTLLEKANEQMEEQEDEIKKLNELILNAKCHAIRDAQLIEKVEIKKEQLEEEKRLDEMMEVERLKALKEYEEREKVAHFERLKGAKVIQLQITDNEQSRLLDEERKDQETKAMLQYLEKLQQEDMENLIKKRETQRALMVDVAKANEEIALLKDRKVEQEKLEEIKVMEYLKQKAEREEAYQRELEIARVEKEKEIARLRAQQERAKDKQAEKDALRAKRNQEEAEREWRKKEKEEAEKKKRTEEMLRAAREDQVKNKEHFLAVQAARDRAEFERVLKVQEEQTLKDEDADRIEGIRRHQHAEEVRQQIREKEKERIKATNAFFEEGIKLDQEAKARRQKLDEIKRRKLQELREAGVPDKYCNEVARRIEAPPPSLSRMY